MVLTYVDGGGESLPEKIGFILELPEPVNIPGGSTYFSWVGDQEDALEGVEVYRLPGMKEERIDSRDRSFVSLSVFQVEHPMSPPVSQAGRIILREVIGEDPTRTAPDHEFTSNLPNTHKTVTFVMTPLVGDDEETAISDAFDHCLATTELYLRAYRYAFSKRLRPLTRQRLPYAILYVRGDLRQPRDWTSGVGIFLLNANVPASYEIGQYSDDAFSRHNAFIGRLAGGDPTGAFLESWLRADDALQRDGDYTATLIFAYQASEVFLDTVLTLLLWEEGLSPADAVSEIFNDRTARRVKTHFKGRLGGDWSTEGRGVIATWAREFAETRHSVVHRGYQPTLDEAQAALACLADLDEFVKARLAGRAFKYPESALLLLGQPGLEKRNGWTRRMQRHALEHPDNTQRVRSYIRWRQQFDPLRTRV